MTMGFRVKDARLLDKVTADDKVRRCCLRAS